MIRGIEGSLKLQYLVSAITLIYASIDSISALTRPIGQSDTERKQFKDWIDAYLLPGSNLTCTAEEFYGARCGMLHTYSPESRLQRESQGTIKRLIYRWRSGPDADAEIPLPLNATVVVVEDLFDAFKTAVDRFLKAVELDPDLANTVNTHRMELLCYKPFEVVDFEGFHEAVAAGDDESDAPPAIGDDGGQFVLQAAELELHNTNCQPGDGPAGRGSDRGGPPVRGLGWGRSSAPPTCRL
jgi:hypothetical protein